MRVRLRPSSAGLSDPHPEKSSDPSEPVWLAPFESTGAEVIIASDHQVSIHGLSPGNNL
jgi:hypothetical protein